MAARRGLGITSKDMEASRLVFVFVRDSKPKRKVAIPVPDNYTWEQFLEQVKVKLKLSGVADIYFSSNGQKVRSVTELQDIDELCVVEGPGAATINGAAGGFAGAAVQRAGPEMEMAVQSPGNDTVLSPASSMMRQQSMAQERHKVVVSADGLGSQRSGSYDDEGSKYARRTNPLKRTLQRLFPNMLQPGLPVTARDAQDSNDGNSRHSRRRRKRSPYDLRNVLLVLATMSCVFTMLYLFIRVSSGPALGGLTGPGQQAAAAAAGAVTDVAAAAAQKAAAVGAAAPGGPDAAAVAAGVVPGVGHEEGQAAARMLNA